MPFCKELNIKLIDLERCESTVELCDNVLECACCCFFLEKHKQRIVDEVLDNTRKLPKEITRIRIPLMPLPANLLYYTFDGIETIIYNLFRTNKNSQIKYLTKYPAYLKVSYEKNSLFNLPIIQIEIIILGKLHEKAIDELWKTLKAEVLFFTGSIGDINVVDIRGRNHLSDILKIPLLVGYPEFKNNGLLLENNFTDSQIKEMNYLHSFTLLPLSMSSVVNNNTLELFALQKKAIGQELNSMSRENSQESDYDIIRAIFENEDELNDIQSDDDFDKMIEELPF